MQGVPETVTIAQLQDAARALGLPLDALRSYSVSLREVTAEVYVLDTDGHKIVHGNHMVTTTLHLSVVPEEVPDAAPHR